MPLELPGYVEIRELGAGASGRVVVARYDATGQLVAAKVLSAQYAADPEFRDRFRREADILGQVRHPNVVALYGYFEGAAQPVILMELIDGVGLERLVERGAMDPEAALVVLSGALQGLDAAHRSGVVHRDVKPANVLVESAGGSHLVDFGVAVRAGQMDVSAGTPVYMAPEQWQGAPASPQTDVYAATGVYYQCITGHWPFPAQTVDQLRAAHLQAWPNVASLPPPIAQLVLRGMAKDPAQRPATAGAFHEEAERAAVAVHGPDWRRRGTIALGGAASAFAAAFPLALAGGHAAAAGTLASAGQGATPGAGAGAGGGAGAGTGSSAGAAAAGVGAHSALLIGAAGVIVVAGGAIGALAATHKGPFSSSPAAASASSSSSRASSSARSGTRTQQPSGSSSSSSSASDLGAILGVSHNSLFPAATGNTWTYSASFGGTTETTTETIQSATPAPGGQNVTLSVTGGTGAPITETFLFKDNGEITATSLSGGVQASSSGVLFTIPTKDDIVAGKTFTNTGTFNIPSASTSVTYTSTVVGGGTETVTVPAGTFNCYKLSLTINVTVPQAPAPTAITEDVDLAEGIGVIRVHSTLGDSVLTASNLVPGGGAAAPSSSSISSTETLSTATTSS